MCSPHDLDKYGADERVTIYCHNCERTSYKAVPATTTGESGAVCPLCQSENWIPAATRMCEVLVFDGRKK